MSRPHDPRPPGPAALLHHATGEGPAAADAWSELEAALASEDPAVARQSRDQAIARLDALEAGLRQRLAAGVPPARFSPLTALAAACGAARETVQSAADRLTG